MPVSSVESKCIIRCYTYMFTSKHHQCFIVIDEFNKCIGKISLLVLIQADLIVSDGLDMFLGSSVMVINGIICNT